MEINEASLLLLKGAIGALPFAVFIWKGQSGIKVLTEKYNSKAAGIITIGTLHIIMGATLENISRVIETLIKLSESVNSKNYVHSLINNNIDIYVQPETLTIIGLSMVMLWINLHLAVDDYDITSIGNSKINIVYVVSTVLLIFF